MATNDLAFVKWVILILVGGYPFLAGLIVYLIRELQKTNRESVTIMQAATIRDKDTISTLDRVNCVLEKVVDLLK